MITVLKAVLENIFVADLQTPQHKDNSLNSVKKRKYTIGNVCDKRRAQDSNLRLETCIFKK